MAAASGEADGTHALEVIGFAEALALVAQHAGSPLGREAISALRPRTDAGAIRRAIEQVGEVMRLAASEAGWRGPDVPDAREPLRAAMAPGAVLSGEELAAVARLIAAVGDAVRELDRHESTPLLAPLRSALHPHDALGARIGRAIHESGDVRDSASPELRRLRRELEGARGKIVRELERFAAGLAEGVRVPDASVTVREGRYVIAIRREGRGTVGGLVHDESASGSTLFVEPPIAIELMNRLRETERAEQREVRRILAELSDAVRPASAALTASLATLTELDSLTGRARYALSVSATPPVLAEGSGPRLRIVRGAHPGLYATGDPVPFDLVLEAGDHTLVVSGPNTGGKTVLLKAIGLIAAFHQAGVVPPVSEGTALPVFRAFRADIGDEQSIAASLSTFSAHLRNLRRILDSAGPRALVLIDELGSGTDPAEGAALARAILEALTASGATTVATTHLGALKRLASEQAGVANASMQFDAERLEPTYRLLKGPPGRSYGLAIARRLGFPTAVVDRADALLPEVEREAERLLADLEASTRAAAESRGAAEALQAATEERAEDIERREEAVAEREAELELAAAEGARAALLDARAEVEAAIAAVRDAASASVEEAAADARSRVEAAARQQSARAERARTVVTSARREGDVPALAAGTRVRARVTGAAGVVREIRDGEATVEVGGVRLRVPVEDLEPVAGDSARSEARAGGNAGGRATSAARERVSPPPSVRDASSEVDLRGLRAEEVAGRLQPALDAAWVADLRSLRIIHGKGHGILREVVEELLAADPRVESARPGARGEGGTGVTVAEFTP